MKILLYNRLNTEPVQRQFDKTIQYLAKGDFRSADVRKMKTQGFYRARLDDTNRLLFQIGEYEGEKYLFILEVILNHDYKKSRFLRGAVVQEEKLKSIFGLDIIPDDDILIVSYLNPNSRRFTILDKIITFDEKQSEIFYHEPPLLLLGAAGCGKTVLALEKMRQAKGDILYVTLSAALARKANEVYYKGCGPIPEQKVAFCSLDEYLRLFLKPKNDRECSFQDFKEWFERIKSTVKIKDVHKLFEEIRGVLTGTFSERGFFSPEEYEQLGVRQSVFPVAERMEVYAFFVRYITWLKTEDLYDPNMFAHFCMAHIRPSFDLVVVDEVQDMTTMQLSAVLKSLKRPDQFLLCGDANQVVHPNFFSWTSVKRLLHQRNLSREIVRLLPSNHRNDENIVKLSNRVLALKNARFGSIDRESSVLMATGDLPEGEDQAVQFFEQTHEVLERINKAASISSQLAVIVLRENDKIAARHHFQTPMIFTVHEAKGLEFSFVVLFNFIGDSSAEFNSICEGVAPSDLNDELQYNRPKDKEDRSLQAYQFYINSLYVAITRAANFLYVVEREPNHPLISLLGVQEMKKEFSEDVPLPYSSLEDWQQAAERLEKFGRKEQADAIRAKFGDFTKPPWSVATYEEYIDIRDNILLSAEYKQSVAQFNSRDLNKLYNHLLFYPDFIGFSTLLHQSKTRAARHLREQPVYLKKILMPYQVDKVQRIENLIKKYGPNHRNEVGLTPLMLATMAGAPNIAKYLLMAGADPNATDNWGRYAFQLAFVKAYKDEHYAKTKLREMVELVSPPYYTLRNHKNPVGLQYGSMDFFIVSIIAALQKEFLYSKRSEAHPAIQPDDIAKLMQYFVTDEQTAKQYKKENIADYMAEAELMLLKNPFLIMLRKGYYTLALHYSVRINDEWVKLQELWETEKMFLFPDEPGVTAFSEDLCEWGVNLTTFVERITELDMMDEDEATSAITNDEGLQDWLMSIGKKFKGIFQWDS